MPHPTEYSSVTTVCLANVYFDGKVVSHTIRFADGSKKTLGLIYPGSFHFGTDAAELMQITAGSCKVKLDGQSNWVTYTADSEFKVPAKSGFDISVEANLCQYICSFLP